MKQQNPIPKNLDDFPEHRKILSKIIETLAQDKRVSGIYLAGSFAKGTPDKYSDLDLYILVQEPEREQMIRDHTKLFKDIGTTSVTFPATHIGDPNQIIVFYEEALPIHVDYQYRTSAELNPREKDKDIVIILDRSGELAKWKNECIQTKENHQPTVQDIQYFENRFWGWVWYTYSKIGRGELWEARDALEYLRNNVIIKLLYFKLGIFNEGNRRLETKFPKEDLLELENSLPPQHTKEAYLHSLGGLVCLYMRVLEEVIDKYKFKNIKLVNRNYFIYKTEQLA